MIEPIAPGPRHPQKNISSFLTFESKKPPFPEVSRHFVSFSLYISTVVPCNTF